MRSIIRFLAALAIGIMLTEAHGQTNKYPFTITISTAQHACKVGSEVRLQIVLTNTTGHDIKIVESLADTQAELDFVINVYDGSGNLLSYTDYGRGVKDGEVTASLLLKILKPRGQSVEQAIISKIYDISAVGSYTVQVEKVVPPSLGKGTVKSNKIEFSVTQ